MSNLPTIPHAFRGRRAYPPSLLHCLGAALCLLASAWPVAAEPLRETTRLQTESTRPPAEQDAVPAATEKLLDEYRSRFRERETLREYNDHLEKMIARQETAIGAAEGRLKEAGLTPNDIVPLMARMLETLKQAIALDPPFLREERAARVTQLGDMLDDPGVAIGEKYRRILEAYFAEADYGRSVETYQGELPVADSRTTVDFLRVGRVALLYRTLDGASAGFWDKTSRSWKPLPAEYAGSFEHGLRLARKQSAPELLKIPVPAPESLP